MSTVPDGVAEGPSSADAEVPYSRARLAGGLAGRTWLWFLGGCLLVTLLPVVFGWRPFLIESGSMEPRISVGDVVIAAPEQDPQALLGRVAVFDDPSREDTVKTHRVVSVADDGNLVTRGDANPTVDSVTVPVTDVRGLGRLLVRFVGLPVVWAQTGQWLWLLLFLVSIGLAVRAVGLDREDDQDTSGEGPPDDVAGTPSLAGSGDRRSSFDVAAVRPLPLDRRVVTSWGRRLAYAAALTAALLLPTSTAAFSATTRNTNNSWAIPAYSYTTEVNKLTPYLYWKLDETTTTTTAADASGNARTGTYNAGGSTTYFTRSVVGGLTTDTPNLAVTLNNASSCINTTSTTAVTGPTTFTVIAWFKAPSSYTSGGKLVGFETPRTGVAAAGSGGTYDRHLYMDGNGRIWFGVYNGADMLISSAAGLNDNAWHMAVGTMSSAGMRLYIDGAQVGTNTNTAGEATTGWWRAGCGNLAGWADGWTGANTPPASSTPTNYPFRASLDEVTVFTSALTASDVRFLYFTR